MSKTRGGRITTSIRDRKKSLPLRHNAKERKIMKLQIIIPAYKEGRYLSSAAKTDHHKLRDGEYSGYPHLRLAKATVHQCPKKAMQLTTDDAWKTQKRVKDSQTPKGLNKGKERYHTYMNINPALGMNL